MSMPSPFEVMIQISEHDFKRLRLRSILSCMWT